MRYEKQSILTRDDNPNGGTDYKAPFPFMVGEDVVLRWNDAESRYGYDSHALRPAFCADPAYADSKGQCWKHSWSFNATESGNIASGHGSELISFAEGVALFLRHDVFSLPTPKSDD